MHRLPGGFFLIALLPADSILKPFFLSFLLYQEEPFSMNLHALTFEQILRLCASMEDPNEISKLIQALEILERNLSYRRKELIGQLKEIETQEKNEGQKRRQAVKSSLRVVRPDGEEEAT
jgi:hypothetical protein